MRRANTSGKRKRPTAHGLIKPWDGRVYLPQNRSAKTLAHRSAFVNRTTGPVGSSIGLQENT